MHVMLISGSVGEVVEILQEGKVIIKLEDGTYETGYVEEVLDESRIDLAM